MKMRTDKPLAASTRERYESNWRLFSEEMGVELPVTEEVVLDWLSGKIAKSEVTAGHLRSVCAAIDNAHEQEDYKRVCWGSSDIANAINNYRHDLALNSRIAKKMGIPPVGGALKRNAAPLLLEDLARFQKGLMKTLSKHPRHLCYVACATLMWAAALRRSEAAALTPEDVQFLGGGRVLVNIQSSKSDQYGDGDTVIASTYSKLPHGTADLLKKWISKRPTNEQNKQLFMFPTSHALGMTMKNKLVEVFGCSRRLTSHSFRVGFATYAYGAEVPPTHIQRILRHKRLDTTAGYWRQVDLSKIADEVEKRAAGKV